MSVCGKNCNCNCNKIPKTKEVCFELNNFSFCVSKSFSLIPDIGINEIEVYFDWLFFHISYYNYKN